MKIFYFVDFKIMNAKGQTLVAIVCVAAIDTMYKCIIVDMNMYKNIFINHCHVC